MLHFCLLQKVNRGVNLKLRLTKKFTSISLLENEAIVLLPHKITRKTRRLKGYSVAFLTCLFVQGGHPSYEYMAPSIEEKFTVD